MNAATTNIAAILLAAGASERMGQPKQLLKIGEETLLQNAARQALSAGLQPVVLVLGAHYEKISPSVEQLSVQIVKNEDWEKGMGSSVACGIQFLQKNHPDLDAAILMLCDQPFADADLLQKLISKYRSSGKWVLASAFADTFGSPALFDRRLFSELAQLQGGQGAKTVMKKFHKHLETVPFPEGQFDLDTPADFESFLKRGKS